MNNDKKVKRIIFAMVGLTAFSGTLFAYDNFYLKQQETNQIIYVAKSDITANTTLTESMFQAISIPKDGVLSSYVTDIKDIAGMQLKGGLLKDEPLSKNRLSTETDLAHNLELRIQPDDSSILVKDNEYINMYVVYSVYGEVKTERVFENKQVKVETATNLENNIINYLTMKVDEDEMLNYLDAKEKGKIIIVKNNELDINQNADKYDRNSENAKNATVKEEEVEDINNETPSVSLVTKTFEEGDTLESLSIKYKTSVEEIKSLNNNKEEFSVGEYIILPAN